LNPTKSRGYTGKLIKVTKIKKEEERYG